MSEPVPLNPGVYFLVTAQAAGPQLLIQRFHRTPGAVGLGGGVGTAVGRSHVPQRSAFLPRQDCGLFQKNRRRASPATTGEKSAVAAALRWPGTVGRGEGEVSRRVGDERRRAATVAQAARRPVGACPPPADVDTHCLQQTCWRMFGSLYTVRRNCTSRHWWRRRRPA